MASERLGRNSYKEQYAFVYRWVSPCANKPAPPLPCGAQPPEMALLRGSWRGAGCAGGLGCAWVWGSSQCVCIHPTLWPGVQVRACSQCWTCLSESVTSPILFFLPQAKSGIGERNLPVP